MMKTESNYRLLSAKARMYETSDKLSKNEMQREKSEESLKIFDYRNK